MLSFGGLPIYIHAPTYFAQEYGVSLGVLGASLLALRSIDFLQDPALGWLADALGAGLPLAIAAAATLLAGAMYALFAVTAPVAPLIWFALCLLVLFSAHSFLTIAFYARGAAKAADQGQKGHVKLAAFREGGALIGVCLAAAMPSVFIALGYEAPMAVYAMIFLLIAVVGVLAMRRQWGGGLRKSEGIDWSILRDNKARMLLLVGFCNAAPVAITSTLFLFFVEHRLGAPELGGVLLLMFFVMAALSVPVWNYLSARIGPLKALLIGMGLSVLTFLYTVTLGTGDIFAFGVVCLITGATLAADMTLLPAMFANRVEQASKSLGQAFGLWAFATKLTLAITAGVTLPLLGWAGFQASGQNSTESLWMLTLLYAAVPCALKLVAMGVLTSAKLETAT